MVILKEFKARLKDFNLYVERVQIVRYCRGESVKTNLKLIGKLLLVLVPVTFATVSFAQTDNDRSPWLDDNGQVTNPDPSSGTDSGSPTDPEDGDIPSWLDSDPDNGSGSGGSDNDSGTGRGSGTREISSAIAVARDLIALGEEFYALVEKGKPVSKVNVTPISVLPRNEDGSPVDELATENWEIPKSKRYSMTLKNLYGMKVVDMVFNLNFSYGGSYDGRGKFLTGVQITVDNVQPAWGYSFDASFKLVSITNMGTADDPIAGATIQMSYAVSTIMSRKEMTKTFFITANGDIERVQGAIESF